MAKTKTDGPVIVVENEQQREAKGAKFRVRALYVITLMELAGQYEVPRPESREDAKTRLASIAAEHNFDPTSWADVLAWLQGDDKTLTDLREWRKEEVAAGRTARRF